LTESGLVFKPADTNDTNATDSFVDPPENLHELPNVTIAGVTYLPPQPVVTMPNVTIDGVLYTATPAEEKAPNATEMEPVIPLVTVLPLEQQNASALNATLPAPEVAPEKLDIIHSLDLGSSDQDYVPSNYTEDPSDPEEVKDVKRQIQQTKEAHEARKVEINKSLDVHKAKLLEARQSIEDLISHQDAQAALRIAESEEKARSQEKEIIAKEL
jgi:hypothetical protein